jgi:alcohol dehydrogenase class IV
MAFSFASAKSIVFGRGKVQEVPSLVESLGGSSIFLITDSRPGAADVLTKILDQAGLRYSTFAVEKEPSTELVSKCLKAAKAAVCDLVIGMGGGSVLDTGKAVSALMTNGGEPLDYMENIGAGKKITKVALPYIAIPTTAGTGAEASANAVLASIEHNQKVSLRSPLMLPAVALVDPDLTASAPGSVTASCGMDAFTHCFESFVTHQSNPMTDGIAREGVVSINVRRCADVHAH